MSLSGLRDRTERPRKRLGRKVVKDLLHAGGSGVLGVGGALLDCISASLLASGATILTFLLVMDAFPNGGDLAARSDGADGC